MKNLIRLEEAAQFTGCVLALYFFSAPWWCYLLLLLGPDISMLGYLAGNKTGAFMYNLFHHKAIAVIILLYGLLSGNEVLQIAGLISLGHSAMDRMFGYGLKYFSGFADTHLGRIGKNNTYEFNEH